MLIYRYILNIGIYLKHTNFSHSLINFPVILFQERVHSRVNGFQVLTIFEKKIHLRCLAEFWIRLSILKGIFQKTRVLGNN